MLNVFEYTKESFGNLFEGGAGVCRYHTPQILKESCEEAIEYNMRGMCVTSQFVKLQKQFLEGSGVKTVGMFSYPYGEVDIETKKCELGKCVERGADSCDGVLNTANIKSGEWGLVEEEACTLVEFARSINPDIELKFIIECTHVTEEELIKASKIIKSSGANFVKTQTGWVPPGPTPRYIHLIREAVGPKFGVKGTSSAYCSSIEGVFDFLAAGADILGAPAKPLVDQLPAYQEKIWKMTQKDQR